MICNFYPPEKPGRFTPLSSFFIYWVRVFVLLRSSADKTFIPLADLVFDWSFISDNGFIVCYPIAAFLFILASKIYFKPQPIPLISLVIVLAGIIGLVAWSYIAFYFPCFDCFSSIVDPPYSVTSS